MTFRPVQCFLPLVILIASTVTAASIEIGSRRELMVDDHLIDRMEGGARLELHHPTPREVVLKQDQPWEGNNGSYYAMLKDGGLFKLYYLSYQVPTLPQDNPSHEMFACYAESKDGIHFTRPELGLVEFNGSKQNNIIWSGASAHDFMAFIDTNPDCKPEVRYKVVGSGCDGTLLAFQSADGIRWTPLKENPIIKGYAFDSENQAFWDPIDKVYRCYFRHFRDGRRDIMLATSTDFVHWSQPEWLAYTGCPPEQLYINVISRYERAPQLFVGFPARYVERPWLESHNHLPDLDHRKLRSKSSLRYGTAITDCVFMTSRDGVNFRRWGEAFIRPGPERKENWLYGDGYMCMGLFETPSANPDEPNELSFYVDENAWHATHQLRRYTIRVDGFVSLGAAR